MRFVLLLLPLLLSMLWHWMHTFRLKCVACVTSCRHMYVHIHTRTTLKAISSSYTYALKKYTHTHTHTYTHLHQSVNTHEMGHKLNMLMNRKMSATKCRVYWWDKESIKAIHLCSSAPKTATTTFMVISHSDFDLRVVVVCVTHILHWRRVRKKKLRRIRKKKHAYTKIVHQQ